MARNTSAKKFVEAGDGLLPELFERGVVARPVLEFSSIAATSSLDIFNFRRRGNTAPFAIRLIVAPAKNRLVDRNSLTPAPLRGSSRDTRKPCRGSPEPSHERFSALRPPLGVRLVPEVVNLQAALSQQFRRQEAPSPSEVVAHVLEDVHLLRPRRIVGVLPERGGQLPSIPGQLSAKSSVSSIYVPAMSSSIRRDP